MFALTKLTAIFFLGIHFFNLAGYQLAFHTSLTRLDRKTSVMLDKGSYHQSDLVEVRIPLSLPYYNRHDQNYERVEGTVRVGGITYDYVQRRITGDTLYLRCLPNYCKSSLEKAKLAKTAEENGQASGDKGFAKKQKADNFPPQPGILTQLRVFFADPRNRTDQIPALSSCILPARPEPPRRTA